MHWAIFYHYFFVDNWLQVNLDFKLLKDAPLNATSKIEDDVTYCLLYFQKFNYFQIL